MAPVAGNTERPADYRPDRPLSPKMNVARGVASAPLPRAPAVAAALGPLVWPSYWVRSLAQEAGSQSHLPSRPARAQRGFTSDEEPRPRRAVPLPFWAPKNRPSFSRSAGFAIGSTQRLSEPDLRQRALRWASQPLSASNVALVSRFCQIITDSEPTPTPQAGSQRRRAAEGSTVHSSHPSTRG
jgi:hypothetical protein